MIVLSSLVTGLIVGTSGGVLSNTVVPASTDTLPAASVATTLNSSSPFKSSESGIPIV